MTATLEFQIFVDRGNGLETDGCWLSDDQERWFESEDDARDAARHLHECYPDCDWVVAGIEGDEIWRKQASTR